MHKRSLLQAVALGATVAAMSSSSLLAQVALSGKVTSAEEGAMEGVLVSAKKGIVTVTVVFWLPTFETLRKVFNCWLL